MRKAAVITGGASGLGLACAERFARLGLTTVIVDISSESGTIECDKMKAMQLDVHFVAADVSSQSAARDAAEEIHARFGAIGTLVNAAGIIRRTSHIDVSHGELSEVLSVNLHGTVYMSQAVHPYMREHGGSIVNFASMLAHYGSKNLLSYAASKGGIVQVTKCLAVDWAEHGIRVNAVSPGYIETKLSSGATANPEFRDRVLSKTPMRRFGKPEEVAAAVEFLCSDAAGFITGVVLPIDGGLLAGDPSLFPPAQS